MGRRKCGPVSMFFHLMIKFHFSGPRGGKAGGICLRLRRRHRRVGRGHFRHGRQSRLPWRRILRSQLCSQSRQGSVQQSHPIFHLILSVSVAIVCFNSWTLKKGHFHVNLHFSVLFWGYGVFKWKKDICPHIGLDLHFNWQAQMTERKLRTKFGLLHYIQEGH